MKKSNLKLIALIALFSGQSFAMTAETSSCLSGLCNPGGFYIGITGLDVVPSETGLGMFTDSWQYASADGSTFTALSKPAKPAYKLQGAARIGFNIPGTANNVELSYFHLDSDTHSIRNAEDNPFAFGSAFFNLYIPIVPGIPFVSDSHLKYKVDQVDLTAGRLYTDASGHFQIHPYGGARFARLSHDLTFLVGYVRTQFRGVGPTLGVDGHFDFGCGFGAAGHIDSSVLMGRIDSDSQLRFGATFDYTSPKTNRVVSSVTGRLGLDYTYMMANNHSNFKIELGYQASEYFSPFDIIRAESFPTQRISGIESNNFSFAGPYLDFVVTV